MTSKIVAIAPEQKNGHISSLFKDVSAQIGLTATACSPNIDAERTITRLYIFHNHRLGATIGTFLKTTRELVFAGASTMNAYYG